MHLAENQESLNPTRLSQWYKQKKKHFEVASSEIYCIESLKAEFANTLIALKFTDRKKHLKNPFESFKTSFF